MAHTTDRPTRVASDLMDSAAVEGKRQSRSAKQQLDHWARVGRSVSSQSSKARRRVEAALAGTLAFPDLTAEEGMVVNAEISAAIDEKMAAVNFGDILAAQGTTTVGLDADGNIVKRHPDGTITVVTAE